LLIIEGRVAKDEFRGEDSVRVSADRIYDLAGARAKYAKQLRLSLNGQANAGTLMEMIKPYVGGQCPVRICYHNGVATCELDLPENLRVRPLEPLIESMRDWLSTENVTLVY
jgi:DNA polymerase III subunit alpha